MPFLVQAEENGALEAEAVGENPSDCRASLLAPVLVVARDEHDVLALAGSRLALIDQGVGGGGKEGRVAPEGDAPAAIPPSMKTPLMEVHGSETQIPTDLVTQPLRKSRVTNQMVTAPTTQTVMIQMVL